MIIIIEKKLTIVLSFELCLFKPFSIIVIAADCHDSCRRIGVYGKNNPLSLTSAIAKHVDASFPVTFNDGFGTDFVESDFL
ncbi:hypothetical protein DERP_010281 [Dermatophagoides pteronyssinus]|uniref:Uncharacterized protein n=1 Tax=Dermatophagoides pteronyssinus TaxID=6956 RepID=A0ABQ8IZA8_DERPT|nr:hypothetical protein DERP_010281 [Dermatophagoides pteronyssinus]